LAAVAIFAAIVGLVGGEVVVTYFFAFSYDIAGVKFVLVDDVIFIDDIVAVFDYMFMSDYALGARAVEYLPSYRFVAALMAAVCAIAIHGSISFTNINTCY